MTVRWTNERDGRKERRRLRYERDREKKRRGRWIRYERNHFLGETKSLHVLIARPDMGYSISNGNFY
jgi:hypothetical protein